MGYIWSCKPNYKDPRQCNFYLLMENYQKVFINKMFVGLINKLQTQNYFKCIVSLLTVSNALFCIYVDSFHDLPLSAVLGCLDGLGGSILIWAFWAGLAGVSTKFFTKILRQEGYHQHITTTRSKENNFAISKSHLRR